jgi:flagellar export protein FliJ
MSPKQLTLILTIRERLETLRKAELAEANASVSRAEQSVQRASDTAIEVAKAMTRGGETTAGDLANLAETSELARRQLSSAKNVLEQQQNEAAESREQMLSARRDVRGVEILRGRLLQRLAREQGLRDQSLSDERAASRTERKP